MLESREGARAPEVVIRTRAGGQWGEIDTKTLFAGRTVVVFSLPGAFTPTCSSSHVPRYQELAATLAAHGVDEIVCVSVNDAFVMEAWQADQGAKDITFLPDGNGAFTRAMGMLVDKSDLGFGDRSWRYSMLVRDGVVERMFVEPEVPGDPFGVSDGDTMLRYVAPDMVPPPDVLLFTKPGCVHCARAEAALAEVGLAYDEVRATPRRLRALPGTQTTPQVFVDGRHIGGADELVTWIAEQRTRRA